MFTYACCKLLELETLPSEDDVGLDYNRQVDVNLIVCRHVEDLGVGAIGHQRDFKGFPTLKPHHRRCERRPEPYLNNKAF